MPADAADHTGTPGPAAPAGPGAARERTLLAWVRTGLSLVGGALVLTRALAPDHPLAALLAGTLGVAVAGLLVARVAERYRAGEPPEPALLLAVTAVASVFALVAALSVVLG